MNQSSGVSEIGYHSFARSNTTFPELVSQCFAINPKPVAGVTQMSTSVAKNPDNQLPLNPLDHLIVHLLFVAVQHALNNPHQIELGRTFRDSRRRLMSCFYLDAKQFGGRNSGRMVRPVVLSAASLIAPRSSRTLPGHG